MTAAVLQVTGLAKQFRDGEQALRILHDLSLTVPPAGRVGICGASGSGKSTLLNCLAGLDQADSGHIVWLGQALTDMTPEQTARFRNRELGFVFQQFHLLAALSAVENVMLPLLIAESPWSDAQRQACGLLTELGMADRLHHRPATLSGGEQQRVAIARAVIMRPKLLLADEPTGNLDPVNGQSILRLLLQLCDSHHMSLILVTHNPELMTLMQQRLELRNGQLVSLT